jgi:hypothetical protein
MHRLLALVALAIPTPASAFCGFYVSGSGDKMFADATQVVLMRDGTRTVLAMQNDYKGPLADFAMVVPVPVVLHEGDVRTLPKEVFDHIDALGSPRLVEYWEQDPCPVGYTTTTGLTIDKDYIRNIPTGRTFQAVVGTVTIEAKFDVAEYQILILSATDSTGLERWLKEHHYRIPDEAERLLRPYVENGSKFFVAKVNPKKVQMVDGHAALSPLRFHYDSDEFVLPIRLGLAASSGKQDLIINIVSPNKRYQVANYKNVFIPTNIDVDDSVKSRFPEFYAALFDKTLEANPSSVVTEYAWTAVPNYHCDPCTDGDVTSPDVEQLGADVVGGEIATGSFVLTRLHARYGKADMRDDLHFVEAQPITGGREVWTKSGLETGTQRSPQSYFQARYAIRHPWDGPITCAHPVRNVWGGPPGGGYHAPITASKVAFAPRGKLVVADVVGRDVWEIGLPRTRKPSATPRSTKAMGLGAGAVAALLLLLLLRRR